MSRLTLLIACLILFGCNSTAKPSVVVQTKIVKVRVPEALLVPCLKKQRGAIETTSDIVNRLIYTEGALAKCGAQIEGIRAQQSEG